MRSYTKLEIVLFVSSSLFVPSISAAGTESFTYDALGRVSFVVAESGATRSYTYDNADNLIQITLGSGFASAADMIVTEQARLASGDTQSVENTPAEPQPSAQHRIKSNPTATGERHREQDVAWIK